MSSSEISSIFTFVYLFSGALLVIVLLFCYILYSVGKMKCMQKAGEKGWKAWIPYYSDYLMYKIVGLNGFLVLIRIFQSILTIISVIIAIFTLIFFKDDLITYYNDYNSSYNSGSTTYSESKTRNEVNGILNQSKYNGIRILSSIVEGFGRIASIAAFIVNIFFAIKISKAYGLSGGYIAGMILIPGIFLLIIGFGKSKYVGEYVVQN